ncbi:MAG: sodium:calcium antiporter [bacterium]|nr:sodium:calcium antiporter [Candidatus Sumerlaeota bacterium]
MNHKHLRAILLALVFTLPGLGIRLAGVELPPATKAFVSGLAILCASFMLLWACDAAQADISQALALAVVALIAVLPEYAVDMYFTWQAGRHPDTGYAHYAIANMTGANRLLIGVAWGCIALIFWLRHRRAVRIGRDRLTELWFLALATIYAFIIPIKGALTWVDGLVFLGIYAWYLVVTAHRPCGETEAVGPAEMLTRLPVVQRRAATAGLFVFAASAILANAEPFCEGLISTGKQLHINEFLLVQWLAPIASEAPEFVVALVFAWRGQGGLALGSLLSAKLNQWTLLVGMIPGVFALSHNSLDHPIPMDAFQMNEVMLTAAQSLLAIVLLSSLRLTVGGAALLFVLFIGQLLSPLIASVYPGGFLGIDPQHMHPFFTVLYVVIAGAIILLRPRRILRLAEGRHIVRPRRR